MTIAVEKSIYVHVTQASERIIIDETGWNGGIGRGKAINKQISPPNSPTHIGMDA